MNIEKDGKAQKIEFGSLNEFYEYIINTPLNESFRWKELHSTLDNYWFTQTHSFEEACELFKNGWSDMSEELTQRLKAEGVFEPTMTYKNVQSVDGFHPIVPLYLMGIPTNMVSKKLTPMKQKVININKAITYITSTKKEDIIDESIKAFKIIKKLESQNYRVNLNIVHGVYEYDEKYFVKIRLKSANEKLNISKLAFPLVHPSMLRRLILRFEEVYPDVSSSFTYGYGRVAFPNDYRYVWPNDILLPNKISKDVNKINTLEDLENI